MKGVRKPALISEACALGMCLLLAFPSIVQGLCLESFASDQANPYTISLNVDQVVLDVTVLDRDGGFVSDLDKGSFHIYEDGRLQAIEFFHYGDVPVTIGLVVDSSGSMRPKRSQVVAAALAFIQACNPHDEMFVIHFYEEVVFGLPPEQLFSNNVAQLRDALLKTRPAGQTALYDAMTAALKHLEKGHHDKKALLVISDGGDNASHHKLGETLMMAQQSNAIIYTVALYDEQSKDQNPKVLKQLSKVSGGEFFSPSTVGEVSGICRQIAKNIRNQYMLAYTPTNSARDGKYRTVQVSAKAPGHKKLLVRTRKGYFAPIATTLTHTAPLNSINRNNP